MPRKTALPGTIQERGGRFRVLVDMGRDPLTGARLRVTETLPSRRAAERRIRELARERPHVRAATRGATVADLLDAYLELRTGSTAAPDLAPATLAEYRQIARRTLRPALGNRPLGALTTYEVDRVYRAMVRRGRAARTVRQAHAVLSGALNQAVRWGWIPENVALRATLPKQARASEERARRGVPTVEAIGAVYGEAGGDLRDAIVLALATGRRLGQLHGVRWSDVDLDGGTITFRRTVSKSPDGGTIVLDDDRQKSRVATVAVDDQAVAMLARRRRETIERALQFGARFCDDWYVLADGPDGSDPLRPILTSTRWRDAARRAGRAVRFHDLRHYHVSALLRAGVDLPTVAHLVGHATPQVTATVYAHVLGDDADRRGADVIGSHVAAVVAG